MNFLPDRRKNYLSSYFHSIKNKDLTQGSHEMMNVQYLSIDMYDPYKEIAQFFFPGIIIRADSFHVLKHLTKAFDRIRLRCRRQTQDDRFVYLLTKFHFIFNHAMKHKLDNPGRFNKRFNRDLNYRTMMNLLFENFPVLKEAYLLKEAYIEFNASSSLSTAEEALDKLILRFADSNIPEYTEFYNLLLNWHQEIINSFSLISFKRINNSYIESRNNQIKRLMYNANGFMKFNRTRNRILYCLNKDDSYKL